MPISRARVISSTDFALDKCVFRELRIAMLKVFRGQHKGSVVILIVSNRKKTRHGSAGREKKSIFAKISTCKYLISLRPILAFSSFLNFFS
jgi:hypothetical protein